MTEAQIPCEEVASCGEVETTARRFVLKSISALAMDPTLSAL